MPSASFVICERDGSGRVTAQYASGASTTAAQSGQGTRQNGLQQVLSGVFLPEGYPATVSSDYTQYQVWNALQAFCSSLASLFASRAVLQAHGVGNASASATNAIFLTVLQEIFSRLTTIIAGYYLGTSLYPEAKTYRLLADVFNDAAIITDTLSPHLATLALSMQYPYLVPTTESPLRIVALCMSGAFRALCGAVAGGSKAALTVHFATAGAKPGDVGDLSAKDGSKETVLALLGMLCGSVVVHYVHGTQETYTVLFVLLFCHLAANVMAVRVIAMRTFNRQRASIAWAAYRSSFDVQGNATSKAVVPTYDAVSRRERIFHDSSWIQHWRTSVPARCFLGVPFASIKGPCPAAEAWIPFLSTPTRMRRETLTDEAIHAILNVFEHERYVLWYASASSAALRLLVSLKDGHSPRDHLRAWAHSHELVRTCGERTPSEFEGQLVAVRTALASVAKMVDGFYEAAETAGWKVDEGALVGGSPVTISVDWLDSPAEDRKNV